MAGVDGDPCADKCEMAKMSSLSPKLLVNGEEVDVSSDNLGISSDDDHNASHGDRESHSDNDVGSTDEPYQPPSEELKENLISQVEFLFSDENLNRDAFLLKHVRRNKEGFVNLKLITSFKKIKPLTSDFRVVSESLKDSQKLELNAEATKIRRREPLPPELQQRPRNPGKVVLATNLPMETPSVENIAEIFSKCGDVAVVRIYRPGKSVPLELKGHFSRFPNLEKNVCAIVEYETVAAAGRACGELNNKDGMNVEELGRGGKKTEKEGNKKERERGRDSECDDKEEKKPRRRGKKGKRVEELVGGSDDSCNSSSDTDNSFSSYGNNRRRYRSPGTPDSRSPGNSPRSSPRSSPVILRRDLRQSRSPLARSPQSSPELGRRSIERQADYSSDSSQHSNSSPWSLRRFSPSQTSPLANSQDGGIQHRMVTRLPRGPDGTRGFQHAIGRGRPINAMA